MSDGMTGGLRKNAHSVPMYSTQPCGSFCMSLAARCQNDTLPFLSSTLAAQSLKLHTARQSNHVMLGWPHRLAQLSKLPIIASSLAQRIGGGQE
jgi:hypothetical protein